MSVVINILIAIGIALLSFIGLIILLLLLILLPYTCTGVEFLSIDGKQKLVLLLFLFNKRVKIPLQLLPQPAKKGKKKRKEKRKKKEETKNKDLKYGFSQFKSDVRRFIKFYNEMSGDVKSSFSYIAKKTDFDDVKFYTNFGFSDPMETGIMTGAVWGVVNIVLSYLNNVFGIRKVDLIVNPVYTKECFDVYFYCIIKLRIVHIITAAVKITKAYFRYRKREKRKTNK